MNTYSYKTKDLTLATFLTAINIPLLDSHKEGFKFVWTFGFKSQEEANQIVNDFYNGVYKVSAIKLFECHRRLKSQIINYENEKVI